MHTCEVSAGNLSYTVSVHRNGRLLAVYVTQPGLPLACYTYSVGGRLEPATAVLQGHAGPVHDLCSSLGRLLVTRFNTPAYVGMAGSFASYEYPELSRLVVDAVSAA